MRALEIALDRTLQVVDRPAPEPGPAEVVIDIAWGGICGSDLAYWRSGVSGTAVQKHPFVLGHEVSGTIARLGEEVTGLAVGDPVTVHPAATTGPLPERLAGRDNLHPHLTYLGSAAPMPHQDGGFAEQLLVGADQVVALPEGLPVRRAVLAEPLGVALHAITRAGGVDGKHVAVSGLGPIGLLLALAAQRSGAARVTVLDPQPQARERALAAGLEDVRDASAGLPDGVEIGFEASGAPASIGALIGGVTAGGTVVQVGNLPPQAVPVSLGRLVSGELTYLGTYRFVREIEPAVAMLAAHDVFDRVITHEFALDDAAEAFRVSAEDRSSSKVALRF